MDRCKGFGKFGARNNSTNINCDLYFEGHVSPNTYGKLMIEIFKYLMLNRGQIPLQYDLLLKHLDLGQKRDPHQAIGVSDEKLFTEEIKQVCRKRNHCVHMKVEKSLQSMSDIINRTDNLFLNFQETEIKEILIIYGATLVSPKNTFQLLLPTNDSISESNSLSVRRCLLHLFRKLVTNEDINNLQSIALTNTFLFVKMKRTAGDNWFLPKPEFIPLSRGIWITFSFKHGPSPIVSITKDGKIQLPDQKYNSIPVVPFNENSQIDHAVQEMECSQETGKNNLDGVEILADKMLDLSLTENLLTDGSADSSDEFIWFQAPVHVKGFQEVDQCDSWNSVGK